MLSIPLLLLIPFLAAAAALVAPPRWPRAPRAAALAGFVAALAVLARLTSAWYGAAAPPAWELRWLPALGLELSFWADGPALFYAWLVVGVGLLVAQYAGHYLAPDDAPRRFYGVMMVFTGAMLGVVLARNVLLMFLFWEMTSLTSFLLIGHWDREPGAAKGARDALAITSLGGLCLMAGIALLTVVQARHGPGSLRWDDLWAAAPAIAGDPLAPAVLALMLAGAFTKSAQFPFHVWLPGAMKAPTPVSAFLHAATMVKAGVYLVGRLYPLFQGHPLWLILVAPAGVATMLVGGYLAVLSRDLKELLAYSTVSQLGLLVAYYGFGYRALGGTDLLTLDLLLVASHALFKGGLFLLCGVVDHATGTRDWTRLGGLRRAMPWTAALTALGCLSMAGMPFTLGFVAKKLFLEAALKLRPMMAYAEDLLLGAAVAANLFTVAYCLRLAVLPFFGRPRERDVAERAHEGGWGLLAAPALLIGLCVIGGLYVPLVETPLSHLVQDAFYATETPFRIAFFKGADALLWISLATYLLGGPAIFLAAPRLEALHARLGHPAPFRRAFDAVLERGLPLLAARTARLVQAPSLGRNVAVTLAVAVALTAAALPWAGSGRVAWPEGIWGSAGPPLVGFAFLALAAALVAGVCLFRTPLVRLLAASLVGLLTAGFFIAYRAPDLALTQVLAESMILVLFLLLLERLRRAAPGSGAGLFGTGGRGSDGVAAAVVAGALGLLVGGLTLAAAGSPARDVPAAPGRATHARFYLTHAKGSGEPGVHTGGGRNAVNVILVDFRGMDTLGEATVLVVAALGVVLLTGPGGRKERGSSPAPPPEAGAEPKEVLPWRLRRRPVVLTGTAGLVAFLAAACAGVLFFAGHNAPGGGFIAGLLTAAAGLPLLLAFPEAVRRFPWAASRGLLPAGLAVLCATGLAPVILGLPFLRSGHTSLAIPWIGPVEVASALAFDFGVYLVVVGMGLRVMESFHRSRGPA